MHPVLCARAKFKNDVFRILIFNFADSRGAVMSKTCLARMILHVVYSICIVIYILHVHAHAILGHKINVVFQYFTSQDAGMGWVGCINNSW